MYREAMTFGKKRSNVNGNANNNKRVSKKGIILTCVFVAAILGASFVVWFLPTGNVPNSSITNMTVTFTDPNTTLMSTESQFTLLQREVQNHINETSLNEVENITEFNSFVDTSIAQNDELMLSLLSGKPDQSLMPDYLNLMSEMKNYSQYLSDLKATGRK
jgi:hypothetical protein